MCGAGLRWVTGRKLVREPSVKGGQVFLPCTRAWRAADAAPVSPPKHFPSKVPDKDFQNRLIILDVRLDILKWKRLSEGAYQAHAKNLAPPQCLRLSSQDHQTIQKSPVWPSAPVFPKLPFFKLKFARLVSNSRLGWDSGEEMPCKCTITAMLTARWFH